MGDSHDTPRVLDTTPAFGEFAKAAFLQAPMSKRDMWHEHYERAHPEVFAAYRAEHPELAVGAITQQLWKVRRRAEHAAERLPELIGDVEPVVRDLLGMEPEPAPLHVLMVGTFATNAMVAQVEEDVAVLHLLEWFDQEGPARVLIAHEDTHAWHQLLLGEPPSEDAAWLTFSEGLAIQASREALPEAEEYDYFWYGVTGFEDWLPWCQENRDELRRELLDCLGDERAAEDFFGSGMVDGRWRVGFFLADDVVSSLKRPLSELVRLDPDEARQLVRDELAK